MASESQFLLEMANCEPIIILAVLRMAANAQNGCHLGKCQVYMSLESFSCDMDLICAFPNRILSYSSYFDLVTYISILTLFLLTLLM